MVWGHEHECQLELRTIESTGVRILQPGSTVPTSLIEAESKLKHSFRLKVNLERMNLEPIRLERQRLMLYRQVELSKTGVPKERKLMLEAYIKQQVQQLLDEYDRTFAADMTMDDMNDPKSYRAMPLVRIKVDYSGGYQTLNLKRFGEEFRGKIANPDSFLKFYKFQTK